MPAGGGEAVGEADDLAASGAEFDLAGDRPVWDIICVDEVNYIFIVDQIR